MTLREELIKYVTSMGVKNIHDAETLAHDVLLDPKAKGYEFRNAKYKTLDYFKVVKRYEERHTSLNVTIDGEEVSLADFIEDDTYDKERLRVSQIEVIKHLMRNADDRAKTIVHTYLNMDSPNNSKVAKALGLDYNQVSRSLSKLSNNYDKKLFGNISCYL